jgi:hypothetical protein
MDEDTAPDGADGGDLRAPRIKMLELASIELPDGRTIGVRVEDVSASGFRMETPVRLDVGMRFLLVLRRYEPVPAEVRWSLDKHAGATFLSSSTDAIR